MYAFVILN